MKNIDIPLSKNVLSEKKLIKYVLAPEHVCNMFFQQDKHYNLRNDFPVPR